MRKTSGIYRRSDSPYWWFSFKLPGKGRIYESTGTTDKKLAGQIYIAKRSEYQKVRHGLKLAKYKLAQLIEDYLERKQEGAIPWDKIRGQLHAVYRILLFDPPVPDQSVRSLSRSSHPRWCFWCRLHRPQPAQAAVRCCVQSLRLRQSTDRRHVDPALLR